MAAPAKNVKSLASLVFHANAIEAKMIAAAQMLAMLAFATASLMLTPSPPNSPNEAEQGASLYASKKLLSHVPV